MCQNRQQYINQTITNTEIKQECPIILQHCLIIRHPMQNHKELIFWQNDIFSFFL